MRRKALFIMAFAGAISLFSAALNAEEVSNGYTIRPKSDYRFVTLYSIYDPSSDKSIDVRVSTGEELVKHKKIVTAIVNIGLDLYTDATIKFIRTEDSLKEIKRTRIKHSSKWYSSIKKTVQRDIEKRYPHLKAKGQKKNEVRKTYQIEAIQTGWLQTSYEIDTPPSLVGTGIPAILVVDVSVGPDDVWDKTNPPKIAWKELCAEATFSINGVSREVYGSQSAKGLKMNAKELKRAACKNQKIYDDLYPAIKKALELGIAKYRDMHPRYYEKLINWREKTSLQEMETLRKMHERK